MEVGMTLVVLLFYAWGAAVTLFVLYVLWRAMRAHERIAEALEKQTSTKV